MKAPETASTRSAERTLIIVRWCAVVFALVQVQTYYIPYPEHLKTVAFGVVAVLAFANVAIMVAHRRIRTPRNVRRLAVMTLAFDVVLTFAFVSIYTFDVDTAIFILIYVLPLEGAIKFQRPGALIVMGVATALYVIRELIGSWHYGYDFVLASVTFRMGIGFMIAGVAGAMSTKYAREHEHVRELYHHEHEAADALRALDELKNTFLTAVAHELRTPLTSVLGFSLTLQSAAAELTPQHRMMLDHIVIQSQRLERLLTDLLDLQRTSSALERGPECDLAVVIRDALAEIKPLIAHRSVTTSLDSVVVHIDRSKVERIIENLVLNADKYTPEGSEITVYLRTERAGTTIVVDDAGPGVPDELKQVVFEPFRRGAQQSDHAPGAGIGLSLVARFTEMHGGFAWVEDRPGGGASFRVFLPHTPEPG